MKFATHMYGNGIGTLRVRIRYSGGEEELPDKILWEMKGEAGNNWYLGQVPVSSPSQSFHVLMYMQENIHCLILCIMLQVVFEGVVGQNALGNIAIDSISFNQGACPGKKLLNQINTNSLA